MVDHGFVSEKEPVVVASCSSLVPLPAHAAAAAAPAVVSTVHEGNH
jgi:hypothetical protein